MGVLVVRIGLGLEMERGLGLRLCLSMACSWLSILVSFSGSVKISVTNKITSTPPTALRTYRGDTVYVTNQHAMLLTYIWRISLHRYIHSYTVQKYMHIHIHAFTCTCACPYTYTHLQISILIKDINSVLPPLPRQSWPPAASMRARSYLVCPDRRSARCRQCVCLWCADESSGACWRQWRSSGLNTNRWSIVMS